MRATVVMQFENGSYQSSGFSLPSEDHSLKSAPVRRNYKKARSPYSCALGALVETDKKWQG
jgi:hypothetical protein